LALYFGYLAAVGRIMLRLNDARGVYNSAWVGALLTIVSSAFISLAGFYFVKNTIQRDRETRVGEILASTPLSKLLYIFSKVLSNLAVLSLMIAILALSAIVMQLVHGEDTHIQLWKLLAPFLFLAIPVMAVVAAVAVLFETIAFLRGGFGNVAYFFLWAFALSLSVIPHFPASDLAGIGVVKDSTIRHDASQ
jgi:ABC-type Na+ efflux pump permease subunit